MKLDSSSKAKYKLSGFSGKFISTNEGEKTTLKISTSKNTGSNSTGSKEVSIKVGGVSGKEIVSVKGKRTGFFIGGYSGKSIIKSSNTKHPFTKTFFVTNMFPKEIR